MNHGKKSRGIHRPLEDTDSLAPRILGLTWMATLVDGALMHPKPSNLQQTFLSKILPYTFSSPRQVSISSLLRAEGFFEFLIRPFWSRWQTSCTQSTLNLILPNLITSLNVTLELRLCLPTTPTRLGSRNEVSMVPFYNNCTNILVINFLCKRRYCHPINRNTQLDT